MKGTKIYIVEDEPLIAMTITTVLRKMGFIIIAEPASSVKEAKEGIASTQPDLVMVDIQLEGQEDGTALAKYLELMGIPYMYLTSQTDPLTLAKVKETSPLNYLVKPFTESGLKTSIEVTWHNFLKLQANDLVFYSDQSQHVVRQQDVLYLKAFDNYCYLYTKKQRHLIPKTLKHMWEQLDERLFAKCHRSYVINLQHIQSMEGDELVVQGTRIPVSRSQKQEIKQRLRPS
ncbi:MAG: response regulator transcription factor [Flavobacteriales bacterium]|nr:response regulator transcription factor [Flavobacteriales bacterium]